VAITHYQNALDIAKSRAEDNPEDVGRLLLKLAAAQRGHLDERAARASYLEVTDLARSNRLPLLFGEAVLGFAGILVLMRPANEQVVALIEEAIALVGDGAPALKAELLTRLAAEHCLHPDGEYLARLRRRAFDAVLDSPAPDALLHLSATPYAGILETMVHPAEVAELIARSLGEAGESGSHRMRAAARMRLASEHLARGHVELHDRLLEAARENAARSGDPYEIGLVHHHRQFRAVMDGRFEEAERLCNEALMSTMALVSPAAVRQIFVLQLGMLRAEQGRLSELMAIIDLTAERDSDVARGSLTSECALAWIAVEVDARDHARSLLEHIMRDLLPHDAGYHSWESQCAILAHICGELEAREHAAELFSLLAPLRGRVIVRGHVGTHGPASLHLGTLADLMGRLDEADAFFEEAAELAEKVGAPPWLARIRYGQARALARSPDPTRVVRAISHVESARELAEKLGMLRIESQSSQLLETLHGT